MKILLSFAFVFVFSLAGFAQNEYSKLARQLIDDDANVSEFVRNSKMPVRSVVKNLHFIEISL